MPKPNNYEIDINKVITWFLTYKIITDISIGIKNYI